jgi:predicted acyl esterase
MFMKRIERSRVLILFTLAVGAMLLPGSSAGQAPAPAKYPALPSETPATVKPADASFDYVRRDLMIPMRDGVKLHTVILVPKGAKGAPILLTRTPYEAKVLTTRAESSHLGPRSTDTTTPPT